MKKLLVKPKEISRKEYLIYFIYFITALLLTALIPKTLRFQYEFAVGKPWKYDDLIAPFSFAIEKTDKQIDQEKKEIEENFIPFYYRDTSITNEVKQSLTKKLIELTKDSLISIEKSKLIIKKLNPIIEESYRKGIIENDSLTPKGEDNMVYEIINNVKTVKSFDDYYKVSEVRKKLRNSILEDTSIYIKDIEVWALSSILPNISYNSELSLKALKDKIDNISLYTGAIQEGEKVVSKGVAIQEDTYLKLLSLKKLYENRKGDFIGVFLGYLSIILLLLFIFLTFLKRYYKDIFESYVSHLLILLHILLFTGVTSFHNQYTEDVSIYIIPYCMIILVLFSFFNLQVGFATFLITIMISSIMATNSYEFVLLQLIAGFSAVISLTQIRYLSQFFYSTIYILAIYILGYLALQVLKTSDFRSISWIEVSWFLANFLLCLLSYPLIYFYVKIFGIMSDIKLLELSDTNHKIMKELMQKAPGSFQHSLQVANLSESVIDKIGGNSLLTRVGALYHDIGKMQNPEYFIENLRNIENPHKNLAYMDSAEIIIGHIPKGVELAQKYGLPDAVIEFIKTHHGTTRVEYFYKNYLQENPNVEVDESRFRYPGPKPTSKETAVVMMTDSVEAAARSLSEYNEEIIDSLVDKIIDGKLKDNQFEYAKITISEINTTRRILKRMLKSIYHIRIQYPENK
jgi:putative nucleotidyltransferase with HDIG domain